MSSLSISKTLELFDNPTISQISLLLLFYKELTAGNLAKLTEKNISTITRNLDKLLEANLICVSKTEAKGNLQVKFWALNPEVINIDGLITNETIEQLPEKEKQKAINQMQNILIAFRGIIKAIYDFQVKNLIKNLEIQDHEEDSNIFTIFLFNKDTGQLFEKKFKEFQKKFLEEHRDDSVGLESVTLDSIITFMVSARLEDVIPPIQ